MKFLCPNCKAKYQISDEKIAGRTLKMDCRRCNHPIVIRGNHLSGRRRPSQSSPSISSPSRKPGGSHVGPTPSRSSRSALGSDFRRQAAAPPAPQRATALDQWHVSINDVPVGPMKRDEVTKKMASGAIKPDSLCWREGFDDWREVRKVPELAALLRKHQRPAAPPPPKKPVFPSPSRPLAGRSSPVRPARPPAGRIPAPPGRQASRPAARAASSTPSNVVPIGGRLGASAAPALEEPDVNDFMDEEPTRVGSSFDFDELDEQIRQAEERQKAEDEGGPTEPAEPPSGELAPEEEAFDPFAVPPAGTPGEADAADTAASIQSPPDPQLAQPAEAQPVPERRRRAIPIGAWIAIAGAMAFGVALAVMVGTHFLTQPAQATNEPNPQPTTDPRTNDPELVVPEDPLPEDPDAEDPDAEDPDAEDPQSDDTSDDPGGDSTAQARRGGSGRSGGSSGRSQNEPELTEAQRQALARAAGGGDTGGPANIAPRPDVLDEGGGGGRAELTSDQVRTVVNRGRARVQQCYTVEARRQGHAPTVRINARTTIGASGVVQRVAATGGSFGNLGTCIERTVRQWRFPRSSGPTTTEIPFVFSGNDG